MWKTLSNGKLLPEKNDERRVRTTAWKVIDVGFWNTDQRELATMRLAR